MAPSDVIDNYYDVTSFPNNDSFIPVVDETVDDVTMTTSTFAVFIDRVVLPVICLFGIFGLLLTLVVLSRKNMLTSTNCYLMAFSGADLIFLVLMATKLLIDAHGRGGDHSGMSNGDDSQLVFAMIGIYAVIMMNVAMLASIWLTVALAAERFVAISKPFLALKVCTVRSAGVVIATIFLCAIICRLPNFWEIHLASYYDNSTATLFRYVQHTEFSFSMTYTTVYPWIVDGVLTSILPFCLLLLLNVSLIVEVKRSSGYLQRNTAVSMTPMPPIESRRQTEDIACVSAAVKQGLGKNELDKAGCGLIQSAKKFDHCVEVDNVNGLKGTSSNGGGNLKVEASGRIGGESEDKEIGLDIEWRIEETNEDPDDKSSSAVDHAIVDLSNGKEKHSDIKNSDRTKGSDDKLDEHSLKNGKVEETRKGRGCISFGKQRALAFSQSRKASTRSGGGTNVIHREERQITVMLIVIVTVFYLCQAPYVFYTAFVSLNQSQVSAGFFVFRHVTILLLALKSAVNFIVYCWFSERFWTTLKATARVCTNRCPGALRSKLQKGFRKSGSYYSLRAHSTCVQMSTM